jgi:hypothetical protein
MAPTSDASNAEQMRRMYAAAPLVLVNSGFEGL